MREPCLACNGSGSQLCHDTPAFQGTELGVDGADQSCVTFYQTSSGMDSSVIRTVDGSHAALSCLIKRKTLQVNFDFYKPRAILCSPPLKLVVPRPGVTELFVSVIEEAKPV